MDFNFSRDHFCYHVDKQTNKQTNKLTKEQTWLITVSPGEGNNKYTINTRLPIIISASLVYHTNKFTVLVASQYLDFQVFLYPGTRWVFEQVPNTWFSGHKITTYSSTNPPSSHIPPPYTTTFPHEVGNILRPLQLIAARCYALHSSVYCHGKSLIRL